MGFLSGLGRVLSIAGPIAAAPFTGGTSLLGMAGLGAGAASAIGAGLGAAGSFLGNNAQALGNVGSITSGAARGAQDARQQENQNRLQQGYLQQGSANAFNQDALQRGQFAAGERDSANRRAMFGGLLGGLQDVQIGRPAGSTIPTFDVQGGLRPSAISPEARQALMAQLSQGPLELPEYREAPGVDLQLGAGAGEKILGGIGLGSSILGGLGGFLGGMAGGAGGAQPTQGRMAGAAPGHGTTPLTRSPGLQQPLPTMDAPMVLTQAPNVFQSRPVRRGV